MSYEYSYDVYFDNMNSLASKILHKNHTFGSFHTSTNFISITFKSEKIKHQEIRLDIVYYNCFVFKSQKWNWLKQKKITDLLHFHKICNMPGKHLDTQ